MMINGYKDWGKKRSLTPKNNKVWRDIRKFCYDQELPPQYLGLQADMYNSNCRKKTRDDNRFIAGKAFEEEWVAPPVSTIHLWVNRFAAENLVEFDTNGDGELDKKEIRPFVEKLYDHIRETHKHARLPPLKKKGVIEVCDRLFKEFDTDDSGTLDFKELVRLGASLVDD